MAVSVVVGPADRSAILVWRQNRSLPSSAGTLMRSTEPSLTVKMVPVSQIVFGSEFPYRFAREYAAYLPTFFKGDDLKAIDRDNALRLVPRLKSA